MEEGPINHRKFKYGGFILHILHSLFDKMLYSVYVHSIDPIFTLLFNTETIRPMSIKIKVSLPLGIEEKQQVLK
jgi:hypothetical protein